MEHQTIGVSNMLQHLLVGTVDTAHGIVHTTILAALGADDKGRHILGEGSTGLNHCAAAHTRLSILDDRRREDDTILNLAVAGNLGTIAKDTAVAHLGVVRDMGTFHQHVIIAYNGLAASMPFRKSLVLFSKEPPYIPGRVYADESSASRYP